jgi:hypothetical protein
MQGILYEEPTVWLFLLVTVAVLLAAALGFGGSELVPWVRGLLAP